MSDAADHDGLIVEAIKKVIGAAIHDGNRCPGGKHGNDDADGWRDDDIARWGRLVIDTAVVGIRRPADVNR